MGQRLIKNVRYIYMKSKRQIQEIFVVNPAGNIERTIGIKQPNGKLLIDNPFYIKKIKQIEKRPDT